MGGKSSKSRTSVAPQIGGAQNQESLQKEWESYEIGEEEIRSVFDAVFYVYDKNSAGYLNMEQFALLMNAFANDCRPPVNITPSDLTSFMDILDKDKNGIVEQNEFTSVSRSAIRACQTYCCPILLGMNLCSYPPPPPSLSLEIIHCQSPPIPAQKPPRHAGRVERPCSDGIVAIPAFKCRAGLSFTPVCFASVAFSIAICFCFVLTLGQP